MTAVTVTPATVEHLPWIRVLFDRLVAEGKAKHLPAYPLMDAEESDAFTLAIYRHLTTNPQFGAWVASVDGEVIGFLAGEIAERAIGRPHRFAAPHYLYVDPAHRAEGGKHGAAALLIEASLAWARAQGVTHIEVAALEGDTQWEDRGLRPYLRKFYVPIEELRVSGHVAKPPTPPVEKPKRGRRTRRMPNGHDRQVEA